MITTKWRGVSHPISIVGAFNISINTLYICPMRYRNGIWQTERLGLLTIRHRLQHGTFTRKHRQWTGKPRNSVASLDETNTQIYFFRKVRCIRPREKLHVTMFLTVKNVLCKTWIACDTGFWCDMDSSIYCFHFSILGVFFKDYFFFSRLISTIVRQ